MVSKVCNALVAAHTNYNSLSGKRLPTVSYIPTRWFQNTVKAEIPSLESTIPALICSWIPWKWKSLSCVWLFVTPMDHTDHVILQARILEWVALPFSRVSSQTRDRTQVSHIKGKFFTSWATRETLVKFTPKCFILFDAFVNWMFSLFSFQTVHCYCIEMQLIFVCWFCVLIVCWIHMLALTDFLVESLGLLTYKIFPFMDHSLVVGKWLS